MDAPIFRAATDGPFMLDEGHGGLQPLGSEGLGAGELDQTQPLESLPPDAMTTGDPLHVPIEGHQDGVVCLRSRAYENVLGTPLDRSLEGHDLVAMGAKHRRDCYRDALVQEDTKLWPLGGQAALPYDKAARMSASERTGYCSRIWRIV